MNTGTTHYDFHMIDRLGRRAGVQITIEDHTADARGGFGVLYQNTRNGKLYQASTYRHARDAAAANNIAAIMLANGRKRAAANPKLTPA